MDLKTLSLITISLFALSSCGGLKTLPQRESDEADPSALANLEMSPETLEFGNVTVDSPTTEVITLTNVGDDLLTIDQVDLAGGEEFWIDSFSALPLDMEAGDSAILIIGYQPEDVADHDALVTVALADVDDMATINVTGTGAVEGDEDDDDDDTTPDGEGLDLSITDIDFGVIDLGDVETYDVLLPNVGIDDVLVVDVYSDDDAVSGSGLSTPQVISSGSEKTLTVAYAPEDEVVTNATLVIQTDLHGDYEITVTGEGVYNEPPDIYVDTGPAIEWVEMILCEISETISIQNQGGGELILSDIYINNDSMSTCGAFEVSWNESETVLGPWESTTAVLTYTATETCIEFADTSSDANVLHFLSDDPDEADYQVSVTVIAGCLM